MEKGFKKLEKDPEIISAERICEEMREIAKKLPKSSNNDEEKIKEQTQFGNNFFFLFLAIKYAKSGPNPILTEHYLKRAEKLYGEKWKKFLQDNNDLVNQIQEALTQAELYFELFNRFNKLSFNPKTQDLATHVEEEINLMGIYNNTWNKLNPLLKQASEVMTLYGIKPEDFYG